MADDKPVTVRLDRDLLAELDQTLAREEKRSQFIRQAIRNEIEGRQQTQAADLEERLDELEARVTDLEENNTGWFF